MSARQFAAWVAVFFFAVMFKFVSASPDKPGGPQAPQPVALADLEPTAAIAPAARRRLLGFRLSRRLR
jgi:hypothetical protein